MFSVKRRWIAVAMALMITLVYATLSMAQEEVTLEVWLTSGANEVQALLPEFYEANPNIKVNVSPLSWSGYEDKVLISFATNSAPDIIMTGASFIAHVVMNDLGIPLNAYTDKWGELDDFAPGALQAMTYQGKLYGLPLMAPSRSLWYRKDLFVEHGLDAEAPPETWEEIRDAARRIVRYEGDKVTRIGMSLSADILVHGFLTNGVKWFTEDSRRAAFNTSAGLETLEFWSQLARDMEYTGNERNLDGGFYEGAVGMLYGYVNPFTASRIDPALLDNLGGPVVMERREKAAFTYPDWAYITTQSEHPDEAWEFMKWLTSSPTLVELMRTVGHPTPRRSAYTDPYYDSPEGEIIRRHFMGSTLPYGQAFEFWPDTNLRLVRAEAWPKVVNQEWSPQAALEWMETRFNARLSEIYPDE